MSVKTPEGKDEKLWMIARKRAGFKRHLATYIVVNIFMWAIWYFTHDTYDSYRNSRFPWPVWTTIGWGVGLAFHYIGAYISPSDNSIEREYEKLKNKI